MSKKKHTPIKVRTARDLAVHCLIAFEKDEHWLQESLKESFGTMSSFTYQDRRTAQELAYGTCRHLLTLDHLINRYSKRPMRQIDPVIVHILRVGLYQVLFMDRTPDFAAVNEAVEQAKSTEKRNAGSFVNAILRSIQRDIVGPATKDTPINAQNVLWVDHDNGILFKNNILPQYKKNLGKYLSIAYSNSQWLVNRWLRQYGQDKVRDLCLTINARPLLTLRTNTLRISPEKLYEAISSGIEAKLDGPAIQILQPTIPELLPGFEEGHFTVQDPTAINVVPKLEVKPGMLVLDLCAAPGGKSTHLAELMNNEGTIYACDVNPAKLGLIRQNADRMGTPIIETCLPEELDDIVAAKGPFDAVLVDAPCSNTGVLARRVEARYLIKPVGIQRLAQIQAELLERAISLTRAKGKILYSTCSIDQVENEQQVKTLLENHPELTLINEDLTMPSIKTETKKGDNSVQMSHWNDGGYTALLQK